MNRTIISHRKYGQEFEEIVGDILIHPYFTSLEAFTHHGINRSDHSIRVAYNSYVIGKKLHLDATAIARGGLLHDFFFDESIEKKRALRKQKKGLKKITAMQGFTHPVTACGNAEKYFEISEKEADIIIKHMFPLTPKPPKYSESWIVNGVDTSMAVKEMFQTFFKHPILVLTGRINKQEGYRFI